MIQYLKHYASLLFIITIFSACSTSDQTSNQKLNIVVTTGMIEDAVKQIVGNHATVTALLGPNSDPHMAQASKGDLKLIHNADIIIKNGLHLEGKLGEALDKFGKKIPCINLSDGIEKSQLLHVDNSTVHDPHLWFDVHLWHNGVAYIADKIIEHLPEHKTSLIASKKDYLNKLQSLHQEITEQIAQIDSSRRILITAHDAFRYFGNAYNIDVLGIQGVSTLSQTSIKKRTSLSDFIIEKEIKAIFPEASVRDNQVNAIIEDCNAKGYHLQVGHTLYSDALGEQNTQAGTYIGMVRYNVTQIIKAIK